MEPFDDRRDAGPTARWDRRLAGRLRLPA